MCFSIKIPFWKIIHFDSGKIIGESRVAFSKSLVHYDPHNRTIGKSLRNFIGELNHYDFHGHCTGYSKRSGRASLIHFTNRGAVSGKTIIVCGIFFFHTDVIE